MDSEKLEIIGNINKHFGEHGWSLSISHAALDFVDRDSSGHFSAGATAIVRIQLTDGVYREEVGCGSCSSCNSKCEAISKARKEAFISGMKGALVNFGVRSGQQFGIPIPGDMVYNKSPLSSPVHHTLKSVITSPVKNVGDGSCPALAATSPLANPLPPTLAATGRQVSAEGDLAKAERIRLQQLRKEEFRRRHLLQQAQVQSKDKQTPSESTEARTPPAVKGQSSNKEKPFRDHGPVSLDVDDDPLMSTQDLEAVVQSATHTSHVSRRLSLASTSPSSCVPKKARV